MRKITKKVLNIALLSTLCAVLFLFCYIVLTYTFSTVKFDKTKITNSNLAINIFDSEKRPLEHTYLNGDYVNLNQIPKSTKDCFISIEDKNFYKHNGINYKRILAATAKNLASFKFKEGASTISQQLIKNTHLTNEKSIKRKLNEIKLTKQLEKTMTKDQIFEYYLNIIYFGDNCYGIQNASEHYFSKPVSKLSLDESAMLAGIIKSPNKYHPIKQYKNCLNRRNLVLSELYKDNKITKEEYLLYKNTNTQVYVNSSNTKMNSYAKATIKEAENILNMPEKQIAIGNYRIYTYMDKTKQMSLENSIDPDLNADCSLISQNCKYGYIEAYAEKSNLSLINMQRQPASAIKPILVYAPAINENIITPSTVILDENVSINGYEPKNIGQKEHGYISVKKALSTSLNIPAVKILSYVGIDKAKTYLSRQNVYFNNKDNNLALALGGMTYGMTLKELTNCYQTLANNGNYIQSSFIDYIVDNKGHVVYKNNKQEKQIYRNDTAFLITDILHECSKTGTAKRLNDLNFYVASKTGTSSISKNNLDAYNISYTTEDIVGCWIGNVDNSPINIVGGGTPTEYVKNYFKKIYISHKPANFVIPSSIIQADIDTIARDNDHIIYRANNLLPERYREKAFFSRFNLPKVNMFDDILQSDIKLFGKVINGVANISFNASIYNEYDLYQIENVKEKLITTFSEKNGPTTYNVSISPNKLYKFYIKAKTKNYITNTVTECQESNYIELFYNV